MAATQAHIIIIGDEILYGQTLDTNSNFISKELSKLSIDLIEISIIPDEEATIAKTISQSPAEIIITTGGLGPTKDDKTRYVIAQLTGSELVLNQEALAWTKAYFENVAKRPMNELNKNQAWAPKDSILIQNKVGTAPGIWTIWNGKIIVNLPGVPYEMKYLLTQEVMPKLIDHIQPDFILHHFIHVLNIPESELAEILEPVESKLPNHIKLAYLPTGKLVKLRLTTAGQNKDKLEKEIKKYTQQIVALIPEHVVGENELDVQNKIAAFLKEKNWMLATAESFTSGQIASQITSKAGSSAYFKGSIVAYSPLLKSSLLRVSSSLIKEKGVVNAEVAKQMASGALDITGADVAVSSTGVAGPGKDEFGIEPGTAFIGLACKDQVEVHEFHYHHLDRDEFTTKLAQIALYKLFEFLKAL